MAADPRPDHEHDWRVKPNVVLTSNPPQRVLVCATCGASKASGMVFSPNSVTSQPHEWEKWNG